MKILKPRIEILYKQDNLIIPCEKGQLPQLQAIIKEIGEGEYEVTIEKKKKKRSLDANAYFWTLLRQLATKMGESYMDIYKNIVRDYGVFEIVPLKEIAIPKWIESWENRGSGDGKGRKGGWFCEDIGECKNYEGYHNIKCYYGTSVYNTEEMSRMIDAVVRDCNEQGIPTIIPDGLFGKEK